MGFSKHNRLGSLVLWLLLIGSGVVRAQTSPLSDLDALRYIASHGDLIEAFGADPAKGRNHYEQWGIKEGRKINFEPSRYMASHADLIQAFKGDEVKASIHYIQYGYKERRQTTFSDLDALQYIATYGDLIQAFGSNVLSAIRHYVSFGYQEGRRTFFDALAYIASHGDLIAAFGTDAVAGVKHYIDWGHKEGRQIVFDALGYLSRYSDLQQAFGSDTISATQHYINWGYTEGRSLAFTVSAEVDGPGTVSQTRLFVNLGERASFLLTPSIGGYLVSVSGCNGTLVGNIYTTAAITNKCKIDIKFSLRPESSPVAQVGPDQTVYLGAKVNLRGDLSYDLNGDSLTFNWLTKRYPGLFSPLLSSSSAANPTFTADDPGVYEFELTVSDGKTQSLPARSVVTVLNSVGPTESGLGVAISHSNNVWVLRDSDLSKKTDFVCNGNIFSMDQGPDGIVLGIRNFELLEINLGTARCAVRGQLPQRMMWIAISPDGTLFGVGEKFNEDLSRTFYRLSSRGEVLSSVKLSGDSNNVHGIDFAPTGELIGSTGTGACGRGFVVIDTLTGVTRCRITLSPGQGRPLGDIDITPTGVIRGVNDEVALGSLWSYDLVSRTTLSNQKIPDYVFGHSISAVIYIP